MSILDCVITCWLISTQVWKTTIQSCRCWWIALSYAQVRRQGASVTFGALHENRGTFFWRVGALRIDCTLFCSLSGGAASHGVDSRTGDSRQRSRSQRDDRLGSRVVPAPLSWITTCWRAPLTSTTSLRARRGRSVARRRRRRKLDGKSDTWRSQLVKQRHLSTVSHRNKSQQTRPRAPLPRPCGVVREHGRMPPTTDGKFSQITTHWWLIFVVFSNLFFS